jgi:polyhydroxyalkanoate synthase
LIVTLAEGFAMNRSTDWLASLLPEHSALQHERAPRPLPLFLELVRLTAETDPDMARAALSGLAAYESADRTIGQSSRPIIIRQDGAALRGCGGNGAAVVLVPSLINPPRILDLDRETSLANAIVGMGRRVFLLDWGPASDRAQLSVTEHVTHLLLPMLGQLDAPPTLLGYCLGGTMAIAAANHVPVRSLITLATPWAFSCYPADGLAALARLWDHARPAAESLDALPMEVLQSAFWSLDPRRTVAKFAKFAALDPTSNEARRFVALEDWANEGEPLPVPAARELIEDFFGANLPGSGRWQLLGRAVTDDLSLPMLHCSASGDRITPADAAPPSAGERLQLGAGHVGMIVGSARHRLHEALARFL